MNDPDNPFSDRAALQHAKKILEAEHTTGGMSPLEAQQYKFFTTMNLLALSMVRSLLAELPADPNAPKESNDAAG